MAHHGDEPRLVFILDLWHPDLQQLPPEARPQQRLSDPVTVIRNNPDIYEDLVKSLPGGKLPSNSIMDFLFRNEEGQALGMVVVIGIMCFFYWRCILAPQVERLRKIWAKRKQKQEKDKFVGPAPALTSKKNASAAPEGKGKESKSKAGGNLRNRNSTKKK